MAAAGNGGQKRTSFPCLATARYTVAAVVSVLTVVVVVMVTIVALRPEKVIFSITSQPIEARPPWWEVNHPAQVNPNVSFLVTLTADNPSGRADVLVENVTIRVLDMPGYYDYGWSPYSSFQTLKEIIFAYEMQANFSVSRQTSHTLWKWILVDDPAVLSYLAHRYGGSASFTAMVQVNATMNGRRSSKRPQVYYCWPVIVVGGSWWLSSSYDRTTSSCLPEKEMDFNVSFSAPAPVPAPAPAPMAPARYY